MKTLYFVEHRGKNVRGQWFLELDRDTNSRAAVIDLIRTREADPVKVLEVCEDDGTCRDVTIEILMEAREPEIRAHVNRLIAEQDRSQDYRKEFVR